MAAALPGSAGALERFQLESNVPASPGFPQGPGAFTGHSLLPLTPGVRYIVFAEGVTSAFGASHWTDADHFHCGTPAAVTMTGGVAAPGPGSDDPEFILARTFPLDRQINPAAFCANRVFPRARDLFRIDFGAGFAHRPDLGAPSMPRASHVYAYDIFGLGKVVKTRVLDDNTTDNYGAFRITIMSGADCVAGGWDLYREITGFDSESECDAFFGVDDVDGGGGGGGGGGNGPTTGGGGGGTTQTPGSGEVEGSHDSGGEKPGGNIIGGGKKHKHRCASRRRFRVHLRIPKGFPVKRVIVKLNGRRVKVIKGKRFHADIDLRGLPKRRVVLSIKVIGRGGRVLSGRRVYHTCLSRKLPGHHPPHL
jgi:hypothetical protein